MLIAAGSVRHESVAISHPIKTAFGTMTERHALLLLLHDDGGHTGVGESWVNFPLWAPWERRAALEHGLIPWIVGREVEDVAETMISAYRAFLGPAQQSGTVGPLLSALCAVELALWDLMAQRQELPLAQVLWANPRERVRVYASGINNPIPWDLVNEHLDAGVTLFKLKLGFGDKTDRQNLDELAGHLDGKALIAVDVNRGWTLEQAQRWLDTLADYQVEWLEEPLRLEEEGDLPLLREQGSIPLAGGENVFLPPGAAPDVLLNTPFAVLQPDLTKYASLSAVLQAVQPLASAERDLIPHFLGSAPGGAASLHVAAGLTAGLLEWDINWNPLRTKLLDPPFEIVDGHIALPERPGIGWKLME
jgi:D-galactarolactone cycloisomerase